MPGRNCDCPVGLAGKREQHQGTENEKVWVDEGLFLVLLSGALQHYARSPYAICSATLRSGLAEMLPRMPRLAKEVMKKDLKDLLKSSSSPERAKCGDREAWLELLRKVREEVDGF